MSLIKKSSFVRRISLFVSGDYKVFQVRGKILSTCSASDGEYFFWYDNEGTVVIQTYADRNVGMTALIIRTDFLKDFLRRQNFSPVWFIYQSKTAMEDFFDHIGLLERWSVYRFKYGQPKIVGYKDRY